MAILDWIYPKKCLGCSARGSYVCQTCQGMIQRRGNSLKYEGIVRKLIKEIKYRGTYDLVSELVEIWGPKTPGGDIFVTSVPMWKEKKRARGYNQAELIAREVARRWGVDYLELLIRKRETKPMYGLDREKRLINVKNAFTVITDIELPISKYVILVDDLITSGTTIRECVYELKRAGFERIIVLSLAR